MILDDEVYNNLINQLHDICMKDWDPIGIKNYEGGYDEYDVYIPYLYEMLIKNKTEQEIFAYLFKIETDHMSLSPNFEKIQKVAHKIYKLMPRG